MRNLLGLCCLLAKLTLCSALSFHSNAQTISSATATTNPLEVSRREMIQWGLSAASMILPLSALAAETSEDGLLSATAVADLLRPIPTFTIVDKKGVPFMVVGDDAKVTGYFFTTYQEASRLLALAKTSADKAIAAGKAEGRSQEELGTNPWKMARISTVPLDSALTLVTKLSTLSRGGGNYFKLAPAEEDVDNALAIIGKDELAEGKVPLFYYADFSTDVDGTKKTPLYFRKSELEDDFHKLNPGSSVPKVLVTEFLSVVSEMVKPGGMDDDLKSLVFIPPRESDKKKKECEKVGGKEAPFFVGQRILVL